MKNLPVYKHPASYAREHDELAAYRASNQANTACKEAIETAIRDHYRDNRLDTAAVDHNPRLMKQAASAATSA